MTAVTALDPGRVIALDLGHVIVHTAADLPHDPAGHGQDLDQEGAHVGHDLVTVDHAPGQRGQGPGQRGQPHDQDVTGPDLGQGQRGQYRMSV